MFCFQCEQTSKGTGCNTFAVCGKDDETAILQDLLVHAAKGVAQYAHRAHRLGARDRAIDRFILEALFIRSSKPSNISRATTAGPGRIRKWSSRGFQGPS